MKLSVLLLAGGVGSRLPSFVPKQYVTLAGKPVVRYSFEKLLPYGEMVVVAHPTFRHHFPEKGIVFAEPGLRRQDSFYNALQAASGDWLLVHDAARPFISNEDIEKLLKEGQLTGAATLAQPLKFTVKEAEGDVVIKTLDRERLWEILTPQLIRRDLAIEGFKKVQENNLTITDDVQLAEIMGIAVKLIKAQEGNLKITTPQDIAWAEWRLCHSIN